MTKLVEAIVECQICARCGLPVQSDGESKPCSCGFSGHTDRKTPALDPDDWSDVT